MNWHRFTRFETKLDYFLFFIVIVKLLFIFAALAHLLLSHSTNKRADEVEPKLLELKKKTEFIFIISMSVLLIYYFFPNSPKKQIDDEISLLFFLFGIIMILTADWSAFF